MSKRRVNVYVETALMKKAKENNTNVSKAVTTYLRLIVSKKKTDKDKLKQLKRNLKINKLKNEFFSIVDKIQELELQEKTL